jgi:hypothetical protein
MNPPQTNWVPGLVVLGAGVAASLAYLLSTRRAGGTTASTTTDDLDATYQRLLAELKEHVANKHLLPAEAWAQEKSRLEQAAAAALRERDGVRHEAAKQEARREKKVQAAAQSTGFFATHPALGGALIGGAVVAFFSYLGLSVSDPRNARPEAMGGAPMAAPPTPPVDAKLEALAAQVKANPDDVDALAGLALRLIGQQRFDEARPLVFRAAIVDPYHVRGRVGRAVMRAVDGDLGGARRELERLGGNYPEAYEGHLYAGMLALEQNDERQAVRDLELYVSTAPPAEQLPFVRMELERMKAGLSGGAGGPP